MNWLIENWSMLVVLGAIIGCITIAIYKWLGKTKEQKIANLKYWLLYAVTMAEKELGSGTGVLKLRDAYGKAIEKFPWIVGVITFEDFSEYVDDALEQMRHLLETNDKIKEIVERNA